MALTYSQEEMQLGTPAPDFALLGVDQKTYSLGSFAPGPADSTALARDDRRALLVIFICNHCPYVIAIQDRLKQLADRYANAGLRVIGINSNDSIRYPADNYSAMQARARELDYRFPYCIDPTQSTARAYGAVCTPDPFLFAWEDGQYRLRYHGRMDDAWKDPSAATRPELAWAIEAVLDGREPTQAQLPATGCSIKWLAE